MALSASMAALLEFTLARDGSRGRSLRIRIARDGFFGALLGTRKSDRQSFASS
jgi:hypothetical protein